MPRNQTLNPQTYPPSLCELSSGHSSKFPPTTWAFLLLLRSLCVLELSSVRPLQLRGATGSVLGSSLPRGDTLSTYKHLLRNAFVPLDLNSKHVGCMITLTSWCRNRLRGGSSRAQGHTAGLGLELGFCTPRPVSPPSSIVALDFRIPGQPRLPCWSLGLWSLLTCHLSPCPCIQASVETRLLPEGGQ